jgi:hypothetical protein
VTTTTAWNTDGGTPLDATRATARPLPNRPAIESFGTQVRGAIGLMVTRYGASVAAFGVPSPVVLVDDDQRDL